MAVREGLLVLLADGERHGYQLKTEWEAATGGTWKINVGQVYTTLDRLVRDGLVSVDQDGDQKRYALTAEGREALAAWWAEPTPAAGLSRDGLVAHVLLAVHSDRDLALGVITRHRTALTRQLQVIRRRTGPTAELPLAESLALDASLVRIESNLRWLDRCEQRLLTPLSAPPSRPMAVPPSRPMAADPIRSTVSTIIPALEFRSVVKRYGSGTTEVRALTDVDLTIDPGQLVAVMGPSGCGKSTMLHVAGALEPVDAGAVSVFGTDLATLDARGRSALRCRDVGFVFQRLNLLPSLTALENVMLPLELQGTSVRTARKTARDTLGAVGISEQLDRHPDDFSGGQQQRIAIARAIVGERRLILADEPTGALDSATSDSVIELLAGLPSATGATVILVTHEPRFAGWADRVIFLRDGRIVDEATADPLDVSGADALEDADLTAGTW